MANTAKTIDTDSWSEQFRKKAVDVSAHRLLMTNFHGTEQEKDLTEKANCNGFGRVRHFTTSTSDGWPPNPLPIAPACKALGLPTNTKMKAQVFQNAVCNWRCWYCYVPFNLLSADPAHSRWLSPKYLVDMYCELEDPPQIIDLSGGQPDLVPEWVPWMMKELKERGMEDKVYLWSDDNLSTDYFWRYLTQDDIDLVQEYKKYGRVCCFKGFDEESFGFNTKADPKLFGRQFELMRRTIELGIDVYAYVTLTSSSAEAIEEKVKIFVDRLQQVDKHLPLRTIPLEIRMFTPVNSRLAAPPTGPLAYQQLAIQTWQRELENRFSDKELSMQITEVPVVGGH